MAIMSTRETKGLIESDSEIGIILAKIITKLEGEINVINAKVDRLNEQVNKIMDGKLRI